MLDAPQRDVPRSGPLDEYRIVPMAGSIGRLALILIGPPRLPGFPGALIDDGIRNLDLLTGQNRIGSDGDGIRPKNQTASR